LAFLIYFLELNAQQITWIAVTSSYTLPAGVSLKKGTRESPKLQIWLLDVDLNNQDIAVRPYLGASALVPTHAASNEAFAAINAGFFSGSTSFSTIIYPAEVKAQNVTSVTRNSVSYPLIRSMFSLDTDFKPSIDWIYHFGSTTNDVYRFAEPLAYTGETSVPLNVPEKIQGTQIPNLLIGVGGAPVLVENGVKKVTYNQEIMWGSGVGSSNNDPRTGVGYTANNHVIMIVADGRQAISEGVSLGELADIFLAFNCVEAMNLDGGGSSGMSVGNQFVSSPSEQRLVPSILAVTSRNKVKMPNQTTFEQIIDTEDPKATKIGTWSESANAGYYGTSKSLISAKGNGSNAYEYNFTPPAGEYCEVFAWWVSSSNRTTDTPFTIKHKYGETIVKMNQTQGGSAWNSLGKFVFKGDGSDQIRITNAATLGDWVVADAVRIISFGEKEIQTKIAENFTQNPSNVKCFPNPFTAQTCIEFQLTKNENVNLQIINNQGQTVEILVNDLLYEGKYSFIFDASKLAKGLYFYKLQTTTFLEKGKLILN